MATWKRQYGNGNLEASIRKWQLGSINTEMATWKRQYGNGNLEASIRKWQHNIMAIFHYTQQFDVARTYLNFMQTSSKHLYANLMRRIYCKSLYEDYLLEKFVRHIRCRIKCRRISYEEYFTENLYQEYFTGKFILQKNITTFTLPGPWSATEDVYLFIIVGSK